MGCLHKDQYKSLPDCSKSMPQQNKCEKLHILGCVWGVTYFPNTSKNCNTHEEEIGTITIEHIHNFFSLFIK